MDPATQYDQWKSFQNGEERGFTYYFKEFYPSFCQFANQLIKDSSESESLVSDALLAVWKHRQKFATPDDYKRYCYTTIKNNCFQWLSNRHQRHSIHAEAGLYIESFEAGALDAIIATELIETLHRSINGLPPKCASIVSKLYVEGKSVKEIARELNLSVSTIKTQKKIGISYLKKVVTGIIVVLISLLGRGA